MSSSPSQSSSALSLSGDTPVPSPPSSDAGDSCSTRVCSRAPSFELKREDKKTQDIQDDGSNEKTIAPERDDKEAWTIEEGRVLPPVEPELKEGGVRGYCAVAGAVLLLVSTFGLSNSFGVFLAQYKLMLPDYPSSTLSWIGSTHLALTFGSSLLSGYLFDKGFFQYQLFFGSSAWIIGMFCLSLSKTYIQLFLSHGVLLGLAVGSCFGPCLSLCATYFVKKRSLVVGCATAGAGLGATILPIMLSNLFPKIGFAATIRATAYLMCGLLLLSNLLMRPRNDLPKSTSTRPAVGPLLAQFARETVMWLVCTGCFLVMMGTFIPLFYIVVYSQSHGANKVLTTYAIPIINFVACFARISSGLLADRIGIFNTAAPFSGLVAIMVFAMLGATTTPATIVFLVLFGVASGGMIALLPSCFLVLSTSVSELGLRSGVGFLFVALSALIGSPLAGALLAQSGTYVAPCCFGGAAAAVGCGLLLAARRCRLAQGLGRGWRV